MTGPIIQHPLQQAAQHKHGTFRQTLRQLSFPEREHLLLGNVRAVLEPRNGVVLQQVPVKIQGLLVEYPQAGFQPEIGERR